ncbi:MAG: ZIP family metal transporter [Acidobacteriota bacterium]
MLVVYALLTCLITLAGGWFAIRFRDRIEFVIAFSAGFLLAIVVLDLLPEIFRLMETVHLAPHKPLLMLLAGFCAIFLLEKLTIVHAERNHNSPGHRHRVGVIAASGLVFHSFLDGMAIGVGFGLSNSVGWLVLSAVIAHDFADGVNTVTLMLSKENTLRKTIGMLVLDAAAPVAGVLVGNSFHPHPVVLVYQLAFFAGFLFYLGASDLLPMAHERPRPALLLTTVGAMLMGSAAVVLIGG